MSQHIKRMVSSDRTRQQLKKRRQKESHSFLGRLRARRKLLGSRGRNADDPALARIPAHLLANYMDAPSLQAFYNSARIPRNEKMQIFKGRSKGQILSLSLSYESGVPGLARYKEWIINHESVIFRETRDYIEDFYEVSRSPCTPTMMCKMLQQMCDKMIQLDQLNPNRAQLYFATEQLHIRRVVPQRGQKQILLGVLAPGQENRKWFAFEVPCKGSLTSALTGCTSSSGAFDQILNILSNPGIRGTLTCSEDETAQGGEPWQDVQLQLFD